MKIASDILRVYRSLHTWVGITAGLLLFIGFYAGSLTMFKQPLDRWISPPQQRLAPLSPAQLDLLVPQVLAIHPGVAKEFTLQLQDSENISAPMIWSQGESGRELAINAPRWQASFSADGKLVTEAIKPSRFGDLVDMLHRTAGVPGFLGDDYLGVYLLGVAGVMYFLALVSGLMLLLPTLVKDFFALRRGKNNKRFWLDAHNVIGISSLPFHLVISLTVIVFAFHDQLYQALGQVVYADQPMFTPPKAALHTYPLEQLLPVSRLVAGVEAEAPGFVVTDLLYMNLDTTRPMVRAGIYQAEALVHGPVTAYVGINPFTGEITNTSMLPGKADTWGGLVNYFFALHYGSYGGDLVRWGYFVMGLGGAFLFYTGNLLWIESRRKRDRGAGIRVQPRATRIMAALTLGVSLGSILGVCLALVSGKWVWAFSLAYQLPVNLNQAYLWVYYTSFLACLLFAFWRGPAQAAWQLLAGCSSACLLIPITSLLALVPGLGFWAYSSTASLAVDLIGFSFALLFALAAYHSRRRAHHGTADSIWFASQGLASGHNTTQPTSCTPVTRLQAANRSSAIRAKGEVQ